MDRNEAAHRRFALDEAKYRRALAADKEAGGACTAVALLLLAAGISVLSLGGVVVALVLWGLS